MSTPRRAICLLTLCLSAACGLLAAPAPVPRLVLVGGGPKPAGAMARFVDWAGGAKARLLVIPCASGVPPASSHALRKDFAAPGPAPVAPPPLAHPPAATRPQPRWNAP